MKNVISETIARIDRSGATGIHFTHDEAIQLRDAMRALLTVHGRMRHLEHKVDELEGVLERKLEGDV